MSYLKKYKRESMESLTRQYATKLPEGLANEFEEWCRELNITPSEALRYLVIEELKRVKEEKERLSYSSETKDPFGYLAVTLDTEEESRGIAQKPKMGNRKPPSSGGKRFDTVQWQFNGYTACPICETWISSGNFARHAKTAKKHPGMTTQEIFSDPKNIEIANRMVEEAKKEAGLL